MKINKIYQNKNIISEMSNFFETENFLQLNQFIEEKEILPIHKKLIKQPFSQNFSPLFHKKQELTLNKITDFEILKFIEYFKSKTFLEYIENITGFNLRLKKTILEKYSHTDYTLLNDLKKTSEESIEVIFDLSENLPQTAGGTRIYLIKEEEIFYLHPTFNTLTIIYRPEELLSFTKYLNCLTKNKFILRLKLNFEIIEEY